MAKAAIVKVNRQHTASMKEIILLVKIRVDKAEHVRTIAKLGKHLPYVMNSALHDYTVFG
jgi:hypothetical protein